jgi:hypothetical protein
VSSATGKDPAASLNGLLALRLRGARGGVIRKHRAMIGLRWTPGRVLRAVLLSLLGSVGMLASLPWLGRFYATFFEEAVWWIGLPAGVSQTEVHVGTLLTIGIPYLRLDGPWPSPIHWLIVGGGTVALLLLSLVLPDRFLPARYFLRFLVMVQSISLGYFALATPPFLYPLPGYSAGLLAAGMAVLVLVPLVLGLAFYIFDHTLVQQLAFTVMLLVHLTVLLPLQVLIHAWLIHNLSALVQPTLFFIFGLLLEVLVFVAFYGWGMSWQGTELPASPAPERRP